MLQNRRLIIIQDVGGPTEVSAVQLQLIETFAAMAVHVNDLSTRGLAGEPVDVGELSLAASTLTRLASRIGIRRVPRTVKADLHDYLEHLKMQDAAE